MSSKAHPAPLYAWYGDDFTGSTDVLEALALHGISTVLFTRTPDEHDLANFAHCRAIGIAGESRSRSPEWMDENLPAVFASLRSLGAPVNHYKVCSTFDSSPRIGSIGRAMEIGAKVFSSEWVPVVAAAPQLGRYVLFSNLFAEARGKVYRIDRHPTMQRHPVTPMDEADLRVHLARQTSIPLDYVDASAFSSGCAAQKLRSGLAAGARAIVFDGLDSSMLQETASLIWKSATNHPIFAVGSSGLTHGLLHHWHRLGCIGDPPVLEAAVPADRLLVLSGSCSPVTAQQIHTARRQGFADFHVNGTSSWTAETDEAVRSLARGESVVLYTALGIADQPESFRHDRNRALGEMMREILLHSGVRRIVIAGGDTASHAISQLGLNALTFAAPLAPGAPLCRAHAPGSTLDGLELVLKGGQIGPDNFFAMVRDGA